MRKPVSFTAFCRQEGIGIGDLRELIASGEVMGEWLKYEGRKAWVVDVDRVREVVESHKEEEAEREREDVPGFNPAAAPVPVPAAAPRGGEPSGKTGEFRAEDYGRFKARREWFESENKRLLYEERAKILLQKDKVENAIQKIFGGLRASLLGMCGRCASDLLEETDRVPENERERTLRRLLRAAVEEEIRVYADRRIDDALKEMVGR